MACFYGLTIGLVLTFDIIIGDPLTGASDEPHREHSAPPLSQRYLVYWIGPLVSSRIAALFHTKILQKTD
jgi:hypothetical protein